jgi:hypothetical protein
MDSLLNHPWLLGGAAAGGLGILASCWANIKIVAWKFCNLFIEKSEIDCNGVHIYLAGYLFKNFKHSKLYDKYYNNCLVDYKSGKYGHVGFELLGNKSLLFWNGWWPFVYNISKTDKPNGQSTTSISLLYIRGTLDVDKIYSETLKYVNSVNWSQHEENKQFTTRYSIKYIPDIYRNRGKDIPENSKPAFWWQMPGYRVVGVETNELGKRVSKKKPLDELIFPERIKNLINEIKLWYSNKQWYTERNIPWKRGWLLYGIGGTGKSSLARAFAEELDMPIFVFNLASLSNEEFLREWKEMQQHTPCIALFEDIDNVFHGRENIRSSNLASSLFMQSRRKPPKKDTPDDNSENEHLGSGFGVNFDTLLNCLDGVDKVEGVFTIITTNDLSKIDPALGRPSNSENSISSRPGRIDKAIELGYMDNECKKVMAERILSNFPGALLAAMDEIENNPDKKETPAQYQERCAQVALKCFWDLQHTVEEDTDTDNEYTTKDYNKSLVSNVQWNGTIGCNLPKEYIKTIDDGHPEKYNQPISTANPSEKYLKIDEDVPPYDVIYQPGYQTLDSNPEPMLEVDNIG